MVKEVCHLLQPTGSSLQNLPAEMLPDTYDAAQAQSVPKVYLFPSFGPHISLTIEFRSGSTLLLPHFPHHSLAVH